MSREPLAVARARSYLHDRFAEKVTLQDLAAEAGVTRLRLTRAFVAAHGLPPHAYLLSVRLNAARHRLAPGDLTREFRRRFWTTPGAYRRAARGRGFLRA